MKVLILILFLFSCAFAYPGENDEVLILPGLRIQPSFKHYSGYLNGSDTRKLHYWFLESESAPTKDPLVLWMNGGPGCSSLDGLLTEHGPFRVTEGGYLDYNPYSWNKIANIIYLESPACVGFSYSTDGKCDASDDSTSLLNYNALKDFFVKFPQFKNRDFYITGESYGGFYVPTLAERIVLSKEVPYIQLKGIAIGNAYSSAVINGNGNLHFAYNHGLISDRLWIDIISTCCHNIDPLHCDVHGSQYPNCQEKVQLAKSQYNKLNPYNIYSACLTAKTADNSLWEHLNVTNNYDRVSIKMGFVSDNDRRLTKLREEYLILTTFKKLFGIQKENSQLPCMPDTLMSNYLNRARIRYALHIPLNLPAWSVCSDLPYTASYKDMDRQYNTFFKLNNFKIWLYNGDMDMVCSYLSEEWYFEHFNRSVLSTRKPWMYKDDKNTPQVGGYVKKWDKFSLITIRGAGHMVPGDQPISAYHMFDSFLNGKEL